jgi:hypothetical protein
MSYPVFLAYIPLSLRKRDQTPWDITRLLTGIKTKHEDVHQLNINVNINHNFQTTPDFFNNYFLSITGKNYSAVNKINNFADYLRLAHNKPFQNIKYQYTSTQVIEKIISSLKSKNSHGYDKISVNIQKLILHMLAQHYVIFVIKCFPLEHS